uniref:Coiled-coil domain containing 122 n=1 Tax=Anolis carolinensis TaxID=28377 RepID=H9GBC3_ANOCA|nr:PREDICTED: coiled-coil domain-containing protein 122 isoform X1 [Anolis carolinensis]XP_008117708.1 PREDICTED: coiled-coil domain-containing protein 122 isoform X1 [Anolis carolinensis]XP_008117709.1 PREDICTED: coiled-coil domain-containing protein 122 isoform X1 [Anolis carolinensis]XP_016852456.1 PREDICTED: coiled-coil domain-containing protein 122 isoform X1 [Anolis carolinensis]|eukprot:XP_008117707.1 PREDICTED: coiled-coil domain-containing protein 122 isoform X1 [Anolis carolinensis]
MATNPTNSSLAEVVKQVADQQNTQASEIERSQTTLQWLQTQLQEFEMQMNCVVSERQATERQMYYQDETIASTKHDCEKLETEITALSAENIKLKFDTELLQEEFQIILLRNNAYYQNIAVHKDYFDKMESKLPLMIELTKKRATVKEMTAHREALMPVLQDPDVHASPIQDEMISLKEDINVLKEAISEKENELRDEKNVHARLRKEIEVQNKRYEAILKRLHCQVNKLQSKRRQWNWNIQQMEEKAAELRKLLGTTD